MASIVADDEVFAQFKEESRKQYKRMWAQFRENLTDFDFDSGPPGKESFVAFFKHLRLEKKFASTNLWTWYDEEEVQCQAPEPASPHHAN